MRTDSETLISLCKQCPASFAFPSHPISFHLHNALRTGQELDPESVASISKAIPSLHSKLSDYNAEISRLESILIRLRHGRDELSLCLDAWESRLAPVRRLPVEILTGIFKDACSPMPISSYFPARNAVQALIITPLRIASVCAFWRSIALATPEMWTCVYAHANQADVSEALCSVISLYQDRSCARPLSIFISALYANQSTRQVVDRLGQDYRVFDKLFAGGLDLTRCRRLVFDIDPFKVLRSYLNLSDEHSFVWPSLECLELSQQDAWAERSYPCTLFERAPKLRELYLRGTDVSVAGYVLPIRQIHSLTLHGCASECVFYLLRSCASLKHLTLSHWDSSGRTRGTSCVLRSLRSLTVIRYGVSDFLETFELPVLTHLVLDTNICTEELYKNVDPRLFPIYYQSMVSRCAKSLTKHQSSLSHLTLKDLPFDSRMVIEFLFRVPNLRRLSIIEKRGLESFTLDQQLTDYLSKPEVLPGLARIDLAWSTDNIDLDEDVIMRMLEYRVDRKILESAVIGPRDGGELRNDTLIRMRPMRERGVEVMVW
ncbi:uncharacterized protein EV420DRAFT_703714 [Desarmillaria tabescens]|uniref:F-box domain-containing protein n=1 Tax=Armillaria tabescens TaxID=1929756 RepID=A0AA39K0C1_ARMTA|nr:uncharacterized protein EV420DRAFT_703714 [Desarmillaria tabescens]KAK0452033.1 hypothetical protein EV420DRAFT_703714 [Desarmillaria tabescens]